MAKSKASKPQVGGVSIKWLSEVAEHDYAAAEAYLSLKVDAKRAGKLAAKLRKQTVTERRANDILRAAGLNPATLEDPGVIKDLIKVIEGKALSPILVVGGDGHADIADGFHRVSLVYRVDPYGVVPLKLASTST